MSKKQTDDWTSWGGVKRSDHLVLTPSFRVSVEEALNQSKQHSQSILPVGFARSYGISGLNSANSLMDMTQIKRFHSFDPVSGILRIDAGASLWDVLSFAVPRGWFLPTTPGTRFVSIGGAIANDVHGKNHHSAGTFGAHILRLGLHRSDQGYLELSKAENSEIFAATLGGLGLTGIILWADIQLVRVGSSYLDQSQTAFANLGEFFELAEELSGTHEHSVAWIDCMAKSGSLGRGIFTAADWSSDGNYVEFPKKTKRTIPFDFPGWSLNRVSVSLFNSAYFHKGRFGQGASRVSYDSYFYPLDQISKWNRIYGSSGFYQYQCVVPVQSAEAATEELLKTISDSGQGSFLVVLKTFGDKKSPGMLSFPHAGTTLALDFPNRGDKTLRLFERLDSIVSEAKGRLYPAKDGRLPAQMMRSGYPMLSQFLKFRDPGISSDFLRQLGV